MQNCVKGGREISHVTYFLNFGIPSISRGWLKLDISNLARLMLITRDTKERNAKLGRGGRKEVM